MLRRSKRKRDLATLSLYQLKNLSHFLPEDSFIPFDLDLKSDPLALIVYGYHELSLRLLSAVVKKRSTDIVRLAGKLDRYPILESFTDELAGYTGVDGAKRRVIAGRMKREFASHIERERKRARRILTAATILHGDKFPVLAAITNPIDRDIFLYISAANGLIDNYYQGDSNPGELSQKIVDTVTELSKIHPRIDVRNRLRPTSPLLVEGHLEIDFGELGESKWEDLNLTVSPMTAGMSLERQDRELRPVSELVDPVVTLSDVILPDRAKAHIESLCRYYEREISLGRKPRLTFLFKGMSGTGKTMTATAIAKGLGKKLLKVSFSEINCSCLPQVAAFFAARGSAQNSVVLFDECEGMISSNPFIGRSDAWVKTLFEKFTGVAVFTTNYDTPAGFDRRMTYTLDFEQPGPKAREAILTLELNRLKSDGVVATIPEKNEVIKIAESFTVPGGYYQQVMQLALARSPIEPTSNKPTLAYEQVEEAFQTFEERLGSKTNDGVREPKISMSQIRLDPTIGLQVEKFVGYAREILERKQCDNALMPQGATALFAGPPGTGKTITAEAIAQSLGISFRRVSPSSFMSMWFGQTEANIKKVFAEAQQEKYLLFVDEAEGLFADRRGDSSGIRKTIVNELLQQVEAFKGVLVIATNFTDILDVAFGRRFLFHVTFPIPGSATRLELWKKWQAELKLEDETVSKLAARFEITGGDIRNVAIRARVLFETAYEELSVLCEAAIRERTGMDSKPMGIRG